MNDSGFARRARLVCLLASLLLISLRPASAQDTSKASPEKSSAGTVTAPPQPAILFAHGFCGNAESWLSAIQPLANSMQNGSQASPVEVYAVDYNEPASLVTYYRWTTVGFFGLSHEWQPIAVPAGARFFVVRFRADSNISDPFHAYEVAAQPIGHKAFELAKIIDQIKRDYRVEDVVVVGHSMGGLDARAYIEGLIGIHYQGDIRGLVTLDTPHAGASRWDDGTLFGTLFPACALSSSVNQTELNPASQTMRELNDPANLSKIPPTMPVVSLVNFVDDGDSGTNDDDGVVHRCEQNLHFVVTGDCKVPPTNPSNLTVDENSITNGEMDKVRFTPPFGCVLLHPLSCLGRINRFDSRLLAAVRTAMNKPPLGAIVSISGNEQRNGIDVVQGDDLIISGWSGDVEDQDGPTIKVRIEDIEKDATLAIPDIDAPVILMNEAPVSFLRPLGWRATLSTGTLALGVHQLQVTATDKDGASALLGFDSSMRGRPLQINIVRATDVPAVLNVSTVENSANGSRSIPQTGSLHVAGNLIQGGSPISAVTVRVDGNLFGATAPSNPQLVSVNGVQRTQMNWSLTQKVSNLSPGDHLVSVLAHDAAGALYEISAALRKDLRFTVTVPNNTLPQGFIDHVVNIASGMQTVTPGSTIHIDGWAADTEDTAPVSHVNILVDNSLVGSATLGISRPDVASRPGHAAWLRSGWSFDLSTTGMSTGIHRVKAVAFDSVGASTALDYEGSGESSFTIAAGSNTAPLGFIDVIADLGGRAGVVQRGAIVNIEGWAADKEQGAPVSHVEIRVDGNLFGIANLGAARTDVVQAYNRSDWTGSGWKLQQGTGSLSVGSHVVTATAFDDQGLSSALPVSGRRSNVLEVLPTSNSAPTGYVDYAVDNVSGSSTLLQNRVLLVSGWAADIEDGSPVSRVDIFIDGNKVTSATLGRSRPDVVAAYGRAKWINSGWQATYNIGTLANGSHTVSATAFDASGTAGPLLRTAQITVGSSLTATVGPASGTVNITQFTVSGAATPNSSVTVTSTRPSGVVATFSNPTDASGHFSFGPFIAAEVGTYRETYTDNSTRAVASLAYTVNALHPQIAISPSSNPLGVSFTRTGSGFSPSGNVTQNVTYPDNTVQVFHVTSDTNGNFSQAFAYVAQPGSYSAYDVDDKTGARSNTIFYSVTGVVLHPQIAITPGANLVGTNFNRTGSGFSSNGSVTQNVTYPGGVLHTFSATADVSGNFNLFFSYSEPGDYSAYDVDDRTGARSNTITYKVYPLLVAAIDPPTGYTKFTNFTIRGTSTPNSSVASNATGPNGFTFSGTVGVTSSGTFFSGPFQRTFAGTYRETLTDNISHSEAQISYTVLPSVSASANRTSGRANVDAFTVTVNGSPNTSITLVVTFPDSSTFTLSQSTNSSGVATFGPVLRSKSGLYREVYTNTVSGETSTVTYTVTP